MLKWTYWNRFSIYLVDNNEKRMIENLRIGNLKFLIFDSQ